MLRVFEISNISSGHSIHPQGQKKLKIFEMSAHGELYNKDLERANH
jgi:hypothetical protein